VSAPKAPAFTPGPWHVGVPPWLGGDDGSESIKTADGTVIVDRSDDPLGCVDDAEREANARLIAAAPELYEALRGTLEYLHDHNSGQAILHQANAALAKAAGQ